MAAWSPDGWKSRPALQQVAYDDADALEAAVAALRALAPLVTPSAIDRLRGLLAEAQDGARFLLQGGDCAERITDPRAEAVTSTVEILAQMSEMLTRGSKTPVIRVGRLAGQYAKPRSSPTERRGAIELPSYFGDLVNQPEPSPRARRADPARLLAAHEHAAATLAWVRAVGGEELFASHEALHLWYESAQLSRAPDSGRYYLLSTHLPWIGDRTRDPSGAHVELVRGVANPIGVKVGPSAEPDDIVRLCEALDPANTPGRLLLISRMGARRVSERLPGIVRAVSRAGRRVLWVCDPMHGNTVTTSAGGKTRDFGEILREVELTFDVHRAAGSRLGGVHFELTGEDVTECTGGAAGITEADLDRNYASLCDPRLNRGQALEMAARIEDQLARGRVLEVSPLP